MVGDDSVVALGCVIGAVGETGSAECGNFSLGGAGYIVFCFVFAHIVSSVFYITFMAFFTSAI